MSRTILAVIGKTGAGKSSFCNKLVGEPHFKVGKDMMLGVTQLTSYTDITIKENDFRVIDTQGYCDPQGKDYQNSQQMLHILKEQTCINAFILVMNGNDIRWDSGQLQMLDLLHQTFHMIWENVVIVINHLPQDAKAIKKRNKHRSDPQLRQMISDNLRKRYNLAEELTFPTFFIDCHYDDNDEEESTAFTSALDDCLIAAKMKQPYNPQVAIAARPQNVKLEQEKKQLEEEKVSLMKMARDNEEKAKNEAYLR